MDNKTSAKKLNSLLERAEYDTEKGEIRIAGTDWILMSGATFRELVKGSEEFLGSGAHVIWQQAGKRAGSAFSGDLVRLGMEFEELPAALEEFFTKGGWGKIRVDVDFTKKEASVTIENSVAARGVEARESGCHSIRGFIAGVSDVMFRTPTECLETRCIAKGDPYCEFQVKRKNNAKMRHQGAQNR
jgi:predicted hydrocarbon binding protein